jgi:hypothetical protein
MNKYGISKHMYIKERNSLLKPVKALVHEQKKENELY